MARGWAEDLGKLGLNNLTMGAEMLVGQDFYQPDVQGVGAKKYAQGQNAASAVGAQVMPGLLNLAVPGLGTGVSAARGFIPNITPGQQQPQDMTPQQNYDPMQRDMFPFGGALPYGSQQTGSNLNTFNGPSHEDGGIPLNGSAEIEKKETVDPTAQYVYSDRLKVPGKDKTFAEASKRFKGKEQDDDITKNTNKLMLDRLREQQEDLKKAELIKGITKFQKKYGGYIKEMAAGGYYVPSEAIRDGKCLASHPMVYGSNAGLSGRTQYDYGGWVEEMDNQDPQIALPTGFEDSGASGNRSKLYNAANQIGMYAPIAYNMYQGQQSIDYYNPVQNPQYNKAIDLVSNMRYNAEPDLAEARRTFKQTKSAINDYAGGSAALALSNLGGAQIRADRQKQSVLANKQNMDNQYKLQEAQVRGNMGESYADQLRRSQLYKLQSEEARRKFTGEGMADVGKVSQINRQMDNQKSQDYLLRRLLIASYGDLGPMAFAGFTK